MRPFGMNLNEDEPHFSDPKEEAKYWKKIAKEHATK